MKYFAFYDENYVVKQVLPVPDSAEESTFSERLGMACKETFKDGSSRGIFAGCECNYVPERDVFVMPKPYESWVLDPVEPMWIAPVAKPSDGRDYFWDEEAVAWQLAESSDSDSTENLSEADMEVLRNVSTGESYSDVLARLSPEGRAWVEGLS
jgi:hypothetical protein